MTSSGHTCGPCPQMRHKSLSDVSHRARKLPAVSDLGMERVACVHFPPKAGSLVDLQRHGCWLTYVSKAWPNWVAWCLYQCQASVSLCGGCTCFSRAGGGTACGARKPAQCYLPPRRRTRTERIINMFGSSIVSRPERLEATKSN